jgi:DNA polymerase alpha subunit A
MKTGSLQFQLESEIRRAIAKYYQGWLICGDPICGHKTREMSVYGRQCLRPGCQGYVSAEVRGLSNEYKQLAN